MGKIIKPGDRHGRVLPASEVELAWDGNALCALVGPDLVEGVPGFGDTVHEALRHLADCLIAEAVWVEIPEARRFDRTAAQSFADGTIRTNVVNLYRTPDDRTCAGPQPNSAHHCRCGPTGLRELPRGAEEAAPFGSVIASGTLLRHPALFGHHTNRVGASCRHVEWRTVSATIVEHAAY
jgi:hypothetical protein